MKKKVFRERYRKPKVEEKIIEVKEEEPKPIYKKTKKRG